jgi:hypothetical protein
LEYSEEFSPDRIAKANTHSRKNIKSDQDVVTGLRSSRIEFFNCQILSKVKTFSDAIIVLK